MLRREALLSPMSATKRHWPAGQGPLAMSSQSPGAAPLTPTRPATFPLASIAYTSVTPVSAWVQNSSGWRRLWAAPLASVSSRGRWRTLSRTLQGAPDVTGKPATPAAIAAFEAPSIQAAPTTSATIATTKRAPIGRERSNIMIPPRLEWRNPCQRRPCRRFFDPRHVTCSEEQTEVLRLESSHGRAEADPDGGPPAREARPREPRASVAVLPRLLALFEGYPHCVRRGRDVSRAGRRPQGGRRRAEEEPSVTTGWMRSFRGAR